MAKILFEHGIGHVKVRHVDVPSKDWLIKKSTLLVLVVIRVSTVDVSASPWSWNGVGQRGDMGSWRVLSPHSVNFKNLTSLFALDSFPISFRYWIVPFRMATWCLPFDLILRWRWSAYAFLSCALVWSMRPVETLLISSFQNIFFFLDNGWSLRFAIYSSAWYSSWPEVLFKSLLFLSILRVRFSLVALFLIQRLDFEIRCLHIKCFTVCMWMRK